MKSAAAVSRRGVLLAGARVAGCGLAAGVQALPATQPLLPAPASLAAELRDALARGRALVLLASLEGCPWCAYVRTSWLAPLRAEGQPVVEIDLRQPAPVLDFQGAASTHAQVARALAVRVAPTVLFLGAGGRELAPRLAGVPLPDFYGAYLQERLTAANRAAA